MPAWAFAAAQAKISTPLTALAMRCNATGALTPSAAAASPP
ncbi:hypothetical protein [Serratia marcescens]